MNSGALDGLVNPTPLVVAPILLFFNETDILWYGYHDGLQYA